MAHQFGAMARGINIIAALLACATAASAVHAPFPHGKTTVYRYSTVVQTSTTAEAMYASVFTFRGTLNVVHDTRDPKLENAYNVVLSDIGTDMFNGYAENYTEIYAAMPTDSAARDILKPFLIVYHPNGTLHGVRIPGPEAKWSKNMKMAMASTLQLDLASMNAGKMTDKPESFVAQEKTIYGECDINYDIDPTAPGVFSVNKTFTPKKCDGFPLREFNNVDNGDEKERNDDSMITDSRRLFEVEKQGDGVLIKRLEAFGMITTISATGASFPHFVITNTKFELEKVKEKSEDNTPLGNFATEPMIHDATYRLPRESFAPGAASDVTQGRRVVKQADLVNEVEKMLPEAIDYLEENHATPAKINMKRAGVINTMLHRMTLMDEESLSRVSRLFRETEKHRAKKMRNIYFGMVSQVGTKASCRYARKVIVNNEVPAWLAMDMLTKLAINVKEPTTELLAEMEDLAKLSEPTCLEVRKAGILSFATMVYRTFKNTANPEANPVLNKYIKNFADHLMSEPTVEMKVVYLMALRNVEIGKIVEFLEQIVDGTTKISEDPERMRLLAIWAIAKPVEKNYATAVRALRPIMENVALPTKLRLAAYEILMRQARTSEDANKIHQYASSQKNRHFYHYHYTTLDSIAKTVDKKNEKLREIIYMIFESTKYPPEGQENIRYDLSGVESIRYVDDYAWYSDKMDIGMIVNELTSDPEVVKFEQTTTDRNGAVSDVAVQVHVEGHHEIKSIFDMVFERGVTQSAVRALLDKIAQSLPALKGLKADVVLSRSGRVVMANHYDLDRLDNITTSVIRQFISVRTVFDYQHLLVERHYEKHVTSELGVPVVIENRVPVVRSVSLDSTDVEDFPSNWDLAIQLKGWKHSDDSMSIYNPIADAWHSIRSVGNAEISLPLKVNLVVTRAETGQRHGFTISFPKLPATISPVAGFVDGAAHLVTVDKIGAKALKESCPSCANSVAVWDGSIPLNSPGPYREQSTEVVGLGLVLSAGSHQCDYGHMSESYLGFGPRWNITYNPHIPHTWLESILRVTWAMRGVATSQFLEIQTGSCGVVLKIEPSAEHPISRIDVTPHFHYYDHDANETNLEYLHADKLTFGGSFDVISAVTNSTVRLWKFDLETNRDRGHLANKLSLHVTRQTPGEKNLKICLEGKKNYQTPPEDELKIGTTNEEIDSKLTITYGLTDGDECVQDESVLAMTLKAQLTDEQRARMKQDLENSECSKDKKNPLFSVAKSPVPRTYNCMNEAIRYTTPRKYTFDVTHKKLTPDFASYVYRRFTYHMEPRERGSFKFSAEFPMDTNSVNNQWMTNTSEFITKTTFFSTSVFDYYGPTLNPLWDYPMDNSRFRMDRLIGYIKHDTRICSIYPKVVMTGDGENIPHTMPKDKWVLISGYHWDKELAIFAKQPKPDQLSFLVFFESNVIHFYTRESDNVFVAKVEKVDKEIEQGLRLPDDETYFWHLRMLKQNDHFVVRLKGKELKLYIGPNDMFITFKDEAQGHVSGLCGHLNGTYPSGAPEYYSISEIAGY